MIGGEANGEGTDGFELSRQYKIHLGLPYGTEQMEGQTNFKPHELKELFRSLLKELMGLLSNPQFESNMPKTEALQTCITNLTNYIKMYKNHQAREELCTILRNQLNEILQK